MRARRLARAARFRAGLARHDAVVAHSPTAFFRFFGDVVALIYVALLRRVGPVLVILTVVVVAAAGILDARGLFDTARRLFALGASKSVFLVALRHPPHARAAVQGLDEGAAEFFGPGRHLRDDADVLVHLLEGREHDDVAVGVGRAAAGCVDIRLRCGYADYQGGETNHL